MDELYPTKLLAFSSQQIEAMLRTVEVLHEKTIVSPNQLRCIGPYTFAEIRLAIALRAIALLPKGETTMRKQLDEGKQARITLLRFLKNKHLCQTQSS